MKETIKTNIFLAFLILFISINDSIQSSDIDIQIIPDANLNATAAFVSLDTQEGNDYLYFKFDFDYHNKVKNKKENNAFFKINTELSFSSRDFTYTSFDLNLDDVNSTILFNENKYIFWKTCTLISKKAINNEYEYYIEINRFALKGKNTVILRIPIIKREGQITIENVFSLPEKLEVKRNNLESLIYLLHDIFSQKGKDNMNKYNNHHHNHIHTKEYEINPYKNQYNNNGLNHYYQHNSGKQKSRHAHYRNGVVGFINGFTFLGIILSQIWMVILVLYCLVNRRKKNEMATVYINNQ